LLPSYSSQSERPIPVQSGPLGKMFFLDDKKKIYICFSRTPIEIIYMKAYLKCILLLVFPILALAQKQEASAYLSEKKALKTIA
jgi:hypothetical protein